VLDRWCSNWAPCGFQGFRKHIFFVMKLVFAVFIILNYIFLGMLAKLRKSDYLVRHVSLSVLMEHLGSHRTTFPEI